jgi:hypothetical protein
MYPNIQLHSRLIAVHKFYRSSFGSFLDGLFSGIFTKPSQQNFLLLSLGFVFAFTRHSVASYLWRAGAVSFKHFTRFYVFFGAPCYQKLDLLFERIIVAAARYVPDDEPIRLRFDDTTLKKTGRKIEGTSTYRNGAGPAGVPHALRVELCPRRDAHPALSLAGALRLGADRHPALSQESTGA